MPTAAICLAALLSTTSPHSFSPSLGVDLGAGAAPGLGGLSLRVDVAQPVFVEAFAGYGLSGPQLGGGLGWRFLEHFTTGMDPWRLSAVAQYSLGLQSTTNTYEELLPLPAPYAGRYHWLNLGAEIDIPFGLFSGAATSPWGLSVSAGVLQRLAFEPAPALRGNYDPDELPVSTGPFLRLRLAYEF